MKKLVCMFLMLIVVTFINSCGENKVMESNVLDPLGETENEIDSVYIAINTINCDVIGAYVLYSSAIYAMEEQGLEPPQGIIVKTKLIKD